MKIDLITPPAALPISLAEAKAHLRVDHTDEDDLVEALIRAAVDHLDGWAGILGRALEPQTWRLSEARDVRLPRSGAVRLPLGPVVSITSITYLDADGAEQTIAGASYWLHGEDVVPDDVWPEGTGLTVTWVAGTGTPPAVKQAILLLVGHWYANREAVTAGALSNAPLAVAALLTPHRLGRRL